MSSSHDEIIAVIRASLPSATVARPYRAITVCEGGGFASIDRWPNGWSVSDPRYATGVRLCATPIEVVEAVRHYIGLQGATPLNLPLPRALRAAFRDLLVAAVDIPDIGDIPAPGIPPGARPLAAYRVLPACILVTDLAAPYFVWRYGRADTRPPRDLSHHPDIPAAVEAVRVIMQI